jgi:hypothetical protein
MIDGQQGGRGSGGRIRGGGTGRELLAGDHGSGSPCPWIARAVCLRVNIADFLRSILLMIVRDVCMVTCDCDFIIIFAHPRLLESSLPRVVTSAHETGRERVVINTALLQFYAPPNTKTQLTRHNSRVILPRLRLESRICTGQPGGRKQTHATI